MPYLQIQTNIPAAKIPENFLKDATTLLAKWLGKPEAYMCVCIEPGLLMSWEGTMEPAAIVQLSNIGGHTPQVTQERTQLLTDHMVKNLGVPANRMYILFHDKERFEVGHGGKTFHKG